MNGIQHRLNSRNFRPHQCPIMTHDKVDIVGLDVTLKLWRAYCGKLNHLNLWVPCLEVSR